MSQAVFPFYFINCLFLSITLQINNNLAKVFVKIFFLSAFQIFFDKNIIKTQKCQLKNLLLAQKFLDRSETLFISSKLFLKLISVVKESPKKFNTRTELELT